MYSAYKFYFSEGQYPHQSIL